MIRRDSVNLFIITSGYFFIEDVESPYERIKDKAIIKWPLQDMPYGTKEFGVKDYDEYCLAFAKRI